uniref:Uncharacterized protein n=1 Tax=Panagrolaimus sp. JU765 TaxID=591449 RepID=A0AC34RLX8_9BILA
MEEYDEISSTEMNNDIPERSYAYDSSLAGEIASPRSHTSTIDREIHMSKLQLRLSEMRQQGEASEIELHALFKKVKLKWEILDTEWKKCCKMFEAELVVNKRDHVDLEWAKDDWFEDVKELLERQNKAEKLAAKKEKLKELIQIMEE